MDIQIILSCIKNLTPREAVTEIKKYGETHGVVIDTTLVDHTYSREYSIILRTNNDVYTLKLADFILSMCWIIE
jgi:hypothetical protein